jgi:hypothetical protein
MAREAAPGRAVPARQVANERTPRFSGNPTGMPIRPFLAGQAFEPETIRDMSLALERVCEALSLKMVDDGPG